jgi:hypothetical protein
MAADASAYATLGLDAGADDGEIERAYKKLIKQHHPDREGGDSARAAEINRAYRELRGERNLTHPLELHDDWIARPGDGRIWLAIAVLLAAATAFLLLGQGPLVPLATRPKAESPRGAAAKSDPMDQPLHGAAIAGAAHEALRLSKMSDEMGLANFSRDCHHTLRVDPTIAQLDRCAAFDDAVIQLQDRDPLRDQGPFSELAVTGRIWSAASALSDDSVAIDARLDRIRLQVELALARGSPPAQEPKANQR